VPAWANSSCHDHKGHSGGRSPWRNRPRCGCQSSARQFSVGVARGPCYNRFVKKDYVAPKLHVEGTIADLTLTNKTGTIHDGNGLPLHYSCPTGGSPVNTGSSSCH
jgi:hypothetical protein